MFSRHIFITVSNIKFHRIRPAGAALIHADRWTDGLIWRRKHKFFESMRTCLKWIWRNQPTRIFLSVCNFSASVISLFLRRTRRGWVTCEAATEHGLWLVRLKTLSRLYLLSVSEHGTANIMSRLVQVLTVKKATFLGVAIVWTLYTWHVRTSTEKII